MREFTIKVRMLQDDDATVVELELPGGRKATGSAKRKPGDKRRPVVGETLALSRALANASIDVWEDAERAMAGIPELSPRMVWLGSKPRFPDTYKELWEFPGTKRLKPDPYMDALLTPWFRRSPEAFLPPTT